MPSRADRGRDIVRQVFGGAFYQQGRGFYSALELLAILRGEILLDNAEAAPAGPSRVLPADGPALYLRPSHDHARRLLVADADLVANVFGTDETRNAVKGLLLGLESPVPGRLRAGDHWQFRHLFPYPAEAIHYDAVVRRGKVNVERYTFRGAGGFAHRVLRTDPDQKRLSSTREQFRTLLSDSGSAVGQLLKSLAERDAVRPPATAAELAERPPFEDEVEAKSFTAAGNEDDYGQHATYDTKWTDLLRCGVNTLLLREGLTAFDRIDSLMHWVPFCLAMHQLAMARRQLQQDEQAAIVFDAGHHTSAVRAEARRHFGGAINDIRNSLLERARAVSPDVLQLGAPWWKGPRTFFTTTLYAVGASNANSGQRHFELRPQLLQTVIRAMVDSPVAHDVFVREILIDRLGIVCDAAGADMMQLPGMNVRDLQNNGQSLRSRIHDIGMLRSLSDATQMVGIHT